MEPRHPEIRVKPVGTDGNAFAILGQGRQALKQAGVPADEVKAFLDEATSGDYQHLLATCLRWVEALTALGHADPVFERAGIVRVGVIRKASRGREPPMRYGRQFGPGSACAHETAAKSRHSEPVYYVFENRQGGGR